MTLRELLAYLEQEGLSLDLPLQVAVGRGGKPLPVDGLFADADGLRFCVGSAVALRPPTQLCPTCKGALSVDNKKCPNCLGQGWVEFGWHGENMASAEFLRTELRKNARSLNV